MTHVSTSFVEPAPKHLFGIGGHCGRTIGIEDKIILDMIKPDGTALKIGGFEPHWFVGLKTGRPLKKELRSLIADLRIKPGSDPHNQRKLLPR